MRPTRWRPFERVFTAGTSAQRYRGEFVFGKRTRTRSFAITTDPVHLPPETTWHLMTNLPATIERTVGNTFGLRTGIEYGFKQAKDELGGADSRLTDAHSIARWWALVMCAYLLVSLQAPALAMPPAQAPAAGSPAATSQHPAWTEAARWKHRLTTLRLLLQPFVCACLLLPLAALAASASPAAPLRGARRPLRAHEYLPPALPKMTEEQL